jgi:hypothetical protein
MAATICWLTLKITVRLLGVGEVATGVRLLSILIRRALHSWTLTTGGHGAATHRHKARRTDSSAGLRD